MLIKVVRFMQDTWQVYWTQFPNFKNLMKKAADIFFREILSENKPNHVLPLFGF